MRYHLIIASLILTGLPLQAANNAPPVRGELIRTLHQGANFHAYKDKAAWQSRAAFLREQVLISAGLWPMPERCPLNAVIFGRIDRDEYTIEKVYFQSYPGFYVTGNLYRPRRSSGASAMPERFPAVLTAHGHWAQGRLYQAPEKEVADQLKNGWETEPDAARFPMQARCASLAKLGCIVFFYDMVGYADSDPERFGHRTTYRDIDSDLHGLSVFGLQSWDSTRALDFLESLPDVDKTRIGMTGASGGATQTIMMMAIDDRLACAAPVNMISASEHQGGCVCENNSLLRVGTDNVELAATFAPRPFIHPTATGDWTKDFLEQGFPEIQATYRLFDAESNVQSMRQTAPHNYNLHAREAVYRFFNQHLKLGRTGVISEPKFTPVPPRELQVWDAEHPRPKDSVDAPGLKQEWLAMTTRQIESLLPHDAATTTIADRVLRPILTHVLGPRIHPQKSSTLDTSTSTIGGIQVTRFSDTTSKGMSPVSYTSFVATDKALQTARRLILVIPGGSAAAIKADGSAVDWVSNLVKSGREVWVPDLLEAPPIAPAKSNAIEFFTGYNYSATARQVQKLLVLIDDSAHSKKIDLIALGDSAAAVLLARAIAPDRIAHAVIDCSALIGPSPKAETDPNFIPHLLRYGGIWPLASLGGSSDLTLAHITEIPAWINATYESAGASGRVHLESDLKPDELVRWLDR